MTTDGKVEPIVRLLTILLVFLILCLFAAEVFFSQDAQFFQVVSNMASGVLGALLGIITGQRGAKPLSPEPSGTPAVGQDGQK